MLRQGVTFCAPGTNWTTKFEDIPFLEENRFTLKSLPTREPEPTVSLTGMTKSVIYAALRSRKIKGIDLTNKQIEFLESLL